jgi:hypothetical protein
MSIMSSIVIIINNGVNKLKMAINNEIMASSIMA